MKSRMMTELYGSDAAECVDKRLEELDPEFNRLVQDFAYETVWSRPGLSMRDKSLVTIAALVALGRDEQTQIHMRGFLNAGGSLDELRAALIHLSVYAGFPAAMNGFAALKKVSGK